MNNDWRKRESMVVYTNTALVVACMVIPYYVVWFLSKRSMMETIVESMLDNLDRDDLIRTKRDKNCEKDIIPVSEIVAKALRDEK